MNAATEARRFDRAGGARQSRRYTHLEITLRMFGQYPDVYRGIEAGAHVEKIFIHIGIDDENLNAALRQDVLDFPVGAGRPLPWRRKPPCRHIRRRISPRWPQRLCRAKPTQSFGHHQIPARRRHQAKANKIVPNPDQRFFLFPGQLDSQMSLQITGTVPSNRVVFFDMLLQFGLFMDEPKQLVLKRPFAECDQSFIFDDLPQSVSEFGFQLLRIAAGR